MLNGVGERAIAIADVMQKAARIQAPIALAGHGLPKSTDSLWGEAFNWSIDCMNRAATVSNPQWQSPFKQYYGKDPPSRLLGFLHPGFVTRERSRKDDPRAVPCFYLGPAPNHPSGTVRVLTKDTRSIVPTRDTAW